MASVQAMYEDTVNLLSRLDEKQLVAVHAIIVELSSKNDEWISPLGIDSEEQLWNHIDHSLAQAKAGMGKDADELIDELMKEYTE